MQIAGSTCQNHGTWREKSVAFPPFDPPFPISPLQSQSRDKADMFIVL